MFAPLLALAVVLLLTPSTAQASASVMARGATPPATSAAATKAPAASTFETALRLAVGSANPPIPSATAPTGAAKTPGTPTVVPSPKKTPPPPPQGHSDWPGRLAVAAAIVALLAVAGAVVRRYVVARAKSSQLEPEPQIHTPAATTLPAPQRGATVPPLAAAAGPGRQAIVCTELHPQGYVEIDRCLYRAVWTAVDEPPPAPGLPVIVARSADEAAEPEVLLAFPPLAQGRPDAR